MDITGDIFIDTGNFVLSVLKERFGGEDQAIEYVINRYFTDWNKTAYSFFPNSVFVHGKAPKEERAEAARKIYIEGKYDYTFRDKIILGGSGSYANFYPTFKNERLPLNVVRAHLFVPFGTFMMKGDNLLTLISTNQPNITAKILLKNINCNIAQSSPYIEAVYKMEYFMTQYQALKTDKVVFSEYRINNYAAKPEVYIDTITHDGVKLWMFNTFWKNKKIWEIAHETSTPSD